MLQYFSENSFIEFSLGVPSHLDGSRDFNKRNSDLGNREDGLGWVLSIRENVECSPGIASAAENECNLACSVTCHLAVH